MKQEIKKGKATDYVAKQYIGNLGKTERGILSVNAYGLVAGITYPLLFKNFPPKGCLKPGDISKTKPHLAREILQELKALGLKIKLVLADSLYGETGSVIDILEHLKLDFIVVFPIRGLQRKFCELIQLMDNFPTLILPFSVPSLLIA